MGLEAQRAAPFAKPVPTAARQCGAETPFLAAPWERLGRFNPSHKEEGLRLRLKILGEYTSLASQLLQIANSGARARMTKTFIEWSVVIYVPLWFFSSLLSRS